MEEKTSFILRVSDGLHQALKAQSAAHGLSLNELCTRKLQQVSLSHFDPQLALQVEKIIRLFPSETVLGLLLYGSYARGEQTAQSDIDLLLVLDSQTPLTRTLYAGLDAIAEDLGKIEVHISHLPSVEGPLSSLWAEVALDGIVLYEKEAVLTRICQQLRRKIASGMYTRKSAHGQTYWVQRASIY